MTYITDIQELRKAERYDSPQERRDRIRARIEAETREYERKNKIEIVAPGVTKDSSLTKRDKTTWDVNK